ncbi:MAG: phytanoyl-CoA dioxygenase family protein [Anditalea sp.]
MEALKEKFDKVGYITLKGFLNDLEIKEITENIERFLTESINMMPQEYVFYENKADSSTLKQLQHLDQYHPFFDQLFHHPKFVGLAEKLLGSPVIPKNMQWFNKPPKIGVATPAHQDGFYFMLEPNQALTMWLALDKVDEENGCVRYIPGSHKKKMRPHGESNVLGFSQGIADYNQMDQSHEIPMLLEPGDLMVHHSLTIHRADKNTSGRTRRGLGLIYYSSLAKENLQEHKKYQEKLKASLLQKNRI